MLLLGNRSNYKLEDILKMVFHVRKFAYFFTNTEVLKPFTGPMDGKAGERILDIITSNLN